MIWFSAWNKGQNGDAIWYQFPFGTKTPLFPVDLLAGIDFLAVFAGATNTPLACTIMGVELFGSEYLICFAIACVLSYLFSGHSGIYLSQRIGVSKGDHLQPEESDSLRTIREGRRPISLKRSEKK